MAKAKYPVRRSQLIAPFGVGAMLVVKGGISLICGGLDHWYKRENANEKGIDENEYKVEEYRLEELLKVEHFRLPPDFREPKANLSVPNTDLSVPFLRFPRWHVCPRCDRMDYFPLNLQRKLVCFDCKNNEKRDFVMLQMPFIAMCEAGHLQDVPWREFVHRTATPECLRKLRYLSSGGAALAAQKIRCECGAERSLGGLTKVFDDNQTFLSKNLAPKEGVFYCQGMRPWLGTNDGEPCQQQLRANLRGASNVWFSQVHTSIYIPQKTEICPADLLSYLRRAEVAAQIQFFVQNDTPLLATMRAVHGFALSSYSDEQIEAALKIVIGSTTTEKPSTAISNEDGETAFRRVEYEVLRQEQKEDLLITRRIPLERYAPVFEKLFSNVLLVDKLRETRAFAGFTRIYPENAQKLNERKNMLRHNLAAEANWLPASIVYGEGLFFELNQQTLRQWEHKFFDQLNNHLRPLAEANAQMCKDRGKPYQPLSPRFVLLHTLAHLLINRLIFECGYSSAALRERIYASEKTDAPMAGILIYTADGDSDGTLGGLVRMGHPGKLESVFFNALDNARWCSSDPVCSELGRHGQGPESCNLAACHSCALIPETSCETFNRFLDRQILINTPANNLTLGFYNFAEKSNT